LTDAIAASIERLRVQSRQSGCRGARSAKSEKVWEHSLAVFRDDRANIYLWRFDNRKSWGKFYNRIHFIHRIL